MNEDIRTLHQLTVDTSKNLVFYLVTTASAAIGFTVTQTQDATLSWTLIPVGVAMVSWLLSFYFGIRQIQSTMGVTKANAAYLMAKGGINPVTGKSVEVDADTIDKTFKPILTKHIEDTGKFSRWQLNSLLFGTVSFIVWYVLEILARTPQ